MTSPADIHPSTDLDSQAFVPVRPIRLLVVDEEAPLTDVLTIALRFEGWQVATAATGAEAVAAASEQQFDAILLDMMLPDHSGVEVVTRFRELGIQTPVIFLTGRNSLEDRLAAYGAGGDDYVTKPFSIEDVTTRLTAVFRRSALSRSSRVVDDLVLDVQTAQAWRAGEPLILRGVELELLRILVEESRMPHPVHALTTRLQRNGFRLSSTQVTRHLESLARVVDEDREPMLLESFESWTLG